MSKALAVLGILHETGFWPRLAAAVVTFASSLSFGLGPIAAVLGGAAWLGLYCHELAACAEKR